MLIQSNDDIKRSYWPTPYEALPVKLRRHLWQICYAEICAGDGRLISHLETFCKARCVFASDINPRTSQIFARNAFSLTKEDIGCSTVVTNPPYGRAFLYHFIDHLLGQGITSWLLLPADFAYRVSSAYVMPYCSRIVAVGPIRFLDCYDSAGEKQYGWFKFTEQRGETKFECLEARFNSRYVPDRLKNVDKRR